MNAPTKTPDRTKEKERTKKPGIPSRSPKPGTDVKPKA